MDRRRESIGIISSSGEVCVVGYDSLHSGSHFVTGVSGMPSFLESIILAERVAEQQEDMHTFFTFGSFCPDFY